MSEQIVASVSGRQPLLVLVSGPPGAGKSTVAAALGAALECAVVSIDDVKARLAAERQSATASSATASSSAGAASAEGTELGGSVGQAAFAQAYATAAATLDLGQDVVLEKAWVRGVSESDLLPLVALSRAVQVHVSAPVEVLVARGLAREARPGLVDMAEVVAAVERGDHAWSDFEPLDLEAPLLSVDSTELLDAAAMAVVAAEVRLLTT